MIQKIVDNMEFKILQVDPDCPAGHKLRGSILLQAERSFDLTQNCEHEDHVKAQIVACLHAYLYSDLKEDLQDLRRQMNNIKRTNPHDRGELMEETSKAIEMIADLQAKIKGI